MEPASLPCLVCGAPIPSDCVHAELGVARCPACKALYDLTGRKAPPRAPAGPAAAPRPKVALPSKFEVDDRGPGGMRVSWRWREPGIYVALVVCIAWDSMVVFMDWHVLTGVASLFELMSSLPFAALGVALTYVVIAFFLNRTDIEVSRGRLTIRHGPVPWRGNLDVPGRALTQLYSAEKITRDEDGTTISYELNAIDRRGVKRTLLKGLPKIDQVLWLEQALERHLGIEDRPVEGELARRSA